MRQAAQWAWAAACAALLAACATPREREPASVAQALSSHVEVLSSNRFAGRAAGTPGEGLTLDYLQAQWKAIGLKSGTHDSASPWRAPFRVTGANGEAVTTYNLIGRIEGTDPQSGAVLLLAHWDHLGAHNATCGRRFIDTICNGAIDNATGLAMITEIARNLRAGPRMKRDVYILATGAEEDGLLGARAFAADPPVPLGKFVAAFNIDSEGLAPAGAPAVVIGEKGDPLAALVQSVADEQAIVLVDPDAVNAMFLRRQDGYALMRAGLPAVMVSASFADAPRLARFMDGNYHRPGDEFETVELGAAVDMVRLHTALVRAAADPARFPGPLRSDGRPVPTESATTP
ncbi:M20/M25/M40 family metallo-hydrolase [Croceicoccus sp. YJ47]|uniref:M20/M25/M40 family metallo-hydrolase n=1 Tax=Croceicoccus sp. YJ47 TaxID=2798724 RepID=UPI001921F639|nr:M20/M25/M40 family metallo-hydrolase [Croceicoccus sp. YJ47]QQN73773.1 M20/M25/M40 family metallo-hydrolase [Croceicoccus sp. YJ47]